MVKYSASGYSLTVKGVQAIQKILEDNNIDSILEFGSGRSTDYFSELGYNVYSFDDDAKYASKNKGVNVVDLVQLSDEEFNEVLSDSLQFLDNSYKFRVTNKRDSRQKNCFYKINRESFPSKFSFVILDGPNGNGRSIAFNVIKNIINFPCYIFIDDYFHHPFVENFKKFFPHNHEIITEKEGKIKGFTIYKIISNE